MLCIGITNVGEVVLAREVLHVGGSGLAAMVTAGGLGTVLGSLCTRFTTARRLGLAPRLRRSASRAMAAELVVCAVLHSFWLVIPALALGGFGNGLALVHDRMLLAHSTPESLHGRLFALQKTCISFAFALSFLGERRPDRRLRRPARVPRLGPRPRRRDGRRPATPARRLASSHQRPGTR